MTILFQILADLLQITSVKSILVQLYIFYYQNDFRNLEIKQTYNLLNKIKLLYFLVSDLF